MEVSPVGMGFQRLLGAAFGLAFTAGGAIALAQTGGGYHDSGVVSAVALEPVGATSVIRQTGGVLSDSADAIKKGAEKVTQAIKPPASPQIPPDDPTSVFSKAKPSPELYLELARFQEQSNRLSQADQAYQQALRLNSKHLGALLLYARFKDRHGLGDEAAEIYQKTVKFYPNEPAVFNDLGLFNARHGKNAEALQAYTRAIQLQPKKEVYRNNIAIVLVDTNQFDKAMEHLLAVQNEAAACYKIGFLLQKKGQMDLAAAYFARALEVNPQMKEAKIWLQHVQSKRAAPPGEDGYILVDQAPQRPSSQNAESTPRIDPQSSQSPQPRAPQPQTLASPVETRQAPVGPRTGPRAGQPSDPPAVMPDAMDAPPLPDEVARDPQGEPSTATRPTRLPPPGPVR